MPPTGEAGKASTWEKAFSTDAALDGSCTYGNDGGVVRRLLLSIVVLVIAVFVTGGALPRAGSTLTTNAKVEARHHPAKVKTIAKLKIAHLEKRADALYDDDDTDDDDDDVAGLMPPQTGADDDDASPQQPTLVTHENVFLASEAPSFTPHEDPLGPASGHRRPEEPPPRA
jgi:hypothetical protein